MYKAVNKENNEECAIKILPAEEDSSKLEFEIEFLRRMSSPYIVSFLEGYNFEGELWVEIIFFVFLLSLIILFYLLTSLFQLFVSIVCC